LSGKGSPRAARVRLSPAGLPVFAGGLDYRFTVASFAPDTGDTLWIEQLPVDESGAAIDLEVAGGYLLALPLTVQLQQDGGNCFGATFSASGVVKNDGVTFKARGE
jgi:hypothetical protein